MSIVSSTGNRASFDDITPPVTTCTLNPPEPNGNNSWYVSDVEITLNATDDMSGVNKTQFRVDTGSIHTYTEPFNISTDREHWVQYRSIDYAGNIEDWKSVEFKIDQTPPIVEITYEDATDIIYTAICIDDTSGIDKVEFYQDASLMYTDYELPYEWIFLGAEEKIISAVGLILNPQFSEENITVFAIVVYTVMTLPFSTIESICAKAYDIAGNSESDITGPPIGGFLSRTVLGRLTFPNNYEGYIGRFLIWATFGGE